MDAELNKNEIRVLGALIEKEMATPEYYPLSLNALMNACNQKSNRDPVVNYDEETVLEAVEVLKDKQLLHQSDLGRVSKYEETFVKAQNFIHSEAAIMCVLMLRGPQTAGEIRGRSERLFAFEDLGAVNNTLDDLIGRGHVERMERQPGRKEVRYRHLLGGEPAYSDGMVPVVTESPDNGPANDTDVRIQNLEERVESLSMQLEEMKRMFEDFKKQFE